MYKLTFAICLMCVLPACIRSLRIPIGVVLDDNDEATMTILKYSLLPLQDRYNFIAVYVPEFTDSTDPAQLDRIMCRLLSNGVYAIIGPTNPMSYRVLVPYSNEYVLPLLSPSEIARSLTPRYSVSMPPSTTRAILELLRYYGWKDFVYIYDESRGAERLHQMFELGYSLIQMNLLGVLKAKDSDHVNQYLRQMELSLKHRQFHVIIDTNLTLAKSIILRHVHDVHVGKSNFHFLITTPILEEFWTGEVSKYGVVNVTGFSSVKPENAFEKEWMSLNPDVWSNAGTSLNESSYLYRDLVSVLGEGLRKLLLQRRLRGENVTRNCLDDKDGRLPFGSQLVDNLKKSIIRDATTGVTKFDYAGERSDVSLSVREFSSLQQKIIGTWSYTGLNVSQRFSLTKKPYALPRKSERQRYTILSILNPPFLMLSSENNQTGAVGKEKLEGYCKDLVDLLAAEMKFDYDIKLVTDGYYGIYNKTVGKWNGIIGDVIQGKADMGVADLHVSAGRHRVVDFADSYMSSSLSVLLKNPQSVTFSGSSSFFVLKAFSSSVWACIVVSAILLSALFHVISIYTGTPDNIEAASGIWGKKFSIISSVWFVLGSGVFQGTGVYPRSMSSRILSATWWAFTTLFLSLFIASITTQITSNVLTESGRNPQFLKLSSLSLETVFRDSMSTGWPKLLITKNNRMHHYIKQSSLPFLKEYRDYLEDHPELFVSRNSDVVQRVRQSNGELGWILESTQAEYHSSREPCETITITDVIDTFVYGIILPLGSPLKMSVSSALGKLQVKGELDRIRQKWIHGNQQCQTEQLQQKFIMLLSFSGVLYFVILGLVVALLIAVGRYFFRSKRAKDRRQRLSFEEVSMGQNLPHPPPELLRDSPPLGEDNGPIDGWAERKLVSPTSFKRREEEDKNIH